MAFNFRINENGISKEIEYDSLFDLTHSENDHSPIDNFYINTRELNKLAQWYDGKIIAGSEPMLTTIPKNTLPNLILLGYTSAVESYFREVIRKLIILDKHSKKSCEKLPITFGATLINEGEMLPEALLENYSFISERSIMDGFKNLLGLKGHYSEEVKKVLSEYENLCHLRHITVHRFGKIGTNNIIQLGLEKHSKCLEKPLSLTNSDLFDLYIICKNTIVVVNQLLFDKIIERSITRESNLWQWDLRKDKRLLQKYFNLFNSNVNLIAPVPKIINLYTEMKKKRKI